MSLGRWAGAIVLLLAIDATAQGSPRDAPKPPAPTYDCGTLSLYVLLRLEGRPTDLPAIEARLPASSPAGYSLAEIRDAARFRGLDLTGVRLPKDARAIDRPALAFLKRGRHGHFLVVRPVGHTGKLVQVIDSTRLPEVVDAARLFRSPEWTGLALVPSRPNWSARIIGLGVAIAPGLVLFRAMARLRQIPREGHAQPA